ncbi:hypothetical protein BDY21DRAFT_369425 [Lineolata rhizophorae]|uniref:37S ribosomal protein mrp10, mitochondrial n=1 Tax=Lineolata rhizophorae TaxID=578093 RepID=A0A6A6P9E8_9PEZI|nr:hypothetical protein BDY21DRAFT_369425 [Lineolata rhizophorae]
MPPRPGKSTVPAAPRLPPLPKLRVRRPNKTEDSPCLGFMTALLGCWASSRNQYHMCSQLENQLRVCMDTSKQAPAKKSNINYHLSRMYPQIVGPRKKK